MTTENPTVLDLDDLAALARETIAERGATYVDPSGAPHYGDLQGDGTYAPSCYVGDILNRIDPSLLAKVARERNISNVRRLFHGSKGTYDGEGAVLVFADDSALATSSAGLAFLATLQQANDAHVHYQEAYRRALADGKAALSG